MENKLYKRVKENLQGCLVTKLENRGILGVPDLLVASVTPAKFATIELKVVEKGKKIKFSPHQISFHIRHKKLPAFILVEWKPKESLLLYGSEQMEDLLITGCETKPLLVYPTKNILWNMLKFKLVSV